jgi:hypothetical protein
MEKEFHLADLDRHPEVLQRITSLEEQLSRIIDGQVALIAYVDKTEENGKTSRP